MDDIRRGILDRQDTFICSPKDKHVSIHIFRHKSTTEGEALLHVLVCVCVCLSIACYCVSIVC